MSSADFGYAAGQQVRVGLAGDVALEAAQDLGLGLAFAGAPGHVVLGGLVAVHTNQGDTPQRVIGQPVAAAVQPVPSVRPDETGIGAAPQSRANFASDFSRSGLSPAVTSSWPAVSTPTPGSAIS